jgi:ATP-binding cassette, subfamily B, multidrug efflux pump
MTKKISGFILFSRWQHKLLLIIFSLVATIAGLIVPLYQQQFIAHFEIKDLLLCALFSFFSFLFSQLTIFSGQKESLKAQASLGEDLYQKSLTNNDETLNHRTTGEIVSLYSTDVPSGTMWLEQTLPFFLTTFFPLVFAPIFLVKFYDIPLTYTMSFVLGIFVFNCLMAYRQSIYFFRFKQLAAQRMGIVNEWVQNIKSIKVLNWVDYYEKKILKKRIEETNNRIQMVTNGQIMNSVSTTINYWINLLVLVIVLYSIERQFSGSEVLTILWICGVFLSRPLRQLPWLLTMLFDGWTSIKRLQDFAELENQPAQIKNWLQTPIRDVCRIKNLNLELNGKKILDQINLEISPRKIFVIIGSLGSGKSSLLKSLVLETSFTASEYYLDSKTGYVPQDSFIMSATIAENISLDYGLKTEIFEPMIETLKKASFSVVAENMPHGLQTVIGERGLNLSGGQRQRLALARVFQNRQNLYLLDDPFSAVDINTEQKLIDTVIDLKNQGASFLMATHRYAVLDKADLIIYMDHGRIKWTGKKSEIEKGSEVDQFLSGAGHA